MPFLLFAVIGSSSVALLKLGALSVKVAVLWPIVIALLAVVVLLLIWIVVLMRSR